MRSAGDAHSDGRTIPISKSLTQIVKGVSLLIWEHKIQQYLDKIKALLFRVISHFF